MSEEIIFYDLPSRQGKCWSLNPWKTRLVLNFKEIPYKTEWIEYPDLKPTFEKWGIPPNDKSTSPYAYTSPTIRLPDGTYVMESRKIADVLERQYPSSPSLRLDSPYQARIESAMAPLLGAVRPLFVPLVPQVFLNPRSHGYFVPSREQAVGMPLPEYARGADKGVDDARPHVKTLGAMFRENADGPFLMGAEPCYADFIVLGWLRMMDGLGCKDKFLSSGVDGGEELMKLYEAGAKWLERDSY